MNPAPTSALDTLAEREQIERDHALVRLQEVQALATQAHLQLAQLCQYRVDYAQRWATQFRAGSAMTVVNCYQSFMQRLDLAVEQQTRVVTQSQQRIEPHEVMLRECELRLAAVQKLIERRRQQTAHQAVRAEQRQSDETAQRVHASTRAARHATELNRMK